MRHRYFPILMSSYFVTHFVLATSAAEKIELVRMNLSDGDSPTIIGELIKETDEAFVVYDIKEGQIRELKREKVRRIARGLNEESAAVGIDLSRFIAWKVQRSMSLSRPTGKIATVDLATIYVNLGSDHGLELGEKLSVYRGSREVVDPDSKHVIDRVRRLIGKLKVVEIRQKVSKCTHIGELEVQYQVGDEVESNAKTAIAVLPFSDESGNPTALGNAFAADLTNGLVAAGVPTVERTKLVDVLNELSIQQTNLISPESAQKFGRQVGASGILLGSIAENVRTSKVNIRLARVSTGEILFSHSRVIPANKLPIVDMNSTVPGTQLPVSSSHRNSLTTLDWERGRKTGNWRIQNGRLVFTGGVESAVTMHYELPKQFRLTLRATPIAVEPTTCIAFYFRSNPEFIVQLAADGSCVIVDGKDPRSDETAEYGDVFADRKLNTIAYTCLNGALEVSVNGRKILIHRDVRLNATSSSDFSIHALGEWSFEDIRVDSP